MKNIHLVVIDPQVDFCSPNGNLYVRGAEHDMTRLSAMVDRLGGKLSDIHVTMDSHQLVDIAHPAYWVDSSGNPPAPNTMILADDVRNGRYMPKTPSLRDYTVKYLETLEASNRFKHLIWPPHCLIGTPGHNVDPTFMASALRWAKSETATIDFVTKGSNPFTEHFSAIRAEVPDPNDPTTQVNTSFIDVLETADVILVAGEASSHCVRWTFMDIVGNFKDPAYARKCVLLTDAMSPVQIGDPGLDAFFKASQDELFAFARNAGATLTTTVDFLRS